ncbi:HEPN/Toprim-associated domain-containing protein [Salinicola avicenniae]|uniref:HEPN/Toprim-associated domain-containing protein n=1 Tax=Salinicola avicenniae TaxID=2916836 RepID=UPI002073F118|nr:MULTISPECIES: HEPN/Toprim-associated domain-containing protein [unclassified Salinicola]
MGTSIELTVGNVPLDYAKNSMGNDYGFLFQEADLIRQKSERINYDYYAEHPEEKAELEESELTFLRPLSRVVPRLNLLGHTLDRARTEYQSIIEEANSILDMVDPSEEEKDWLTFEDFCSLANIYPLTSLATDHVDFDTEDRAKVAQGRFAAHAQKFSRLPWTGSYDSYWSESSYLSAKICILSAESMLQVFALNSENADAEVVWEFGPIVNAGWVNRSMFQAGAQRQQSILVATEGASDARIIRRALDILRPDVADFFHFIDGDERHHFWGTGNLVKFAEGLIRIDMQNRVLFLLDNDAEGVDAYRKLQGSQMPGTMRSMLLPDIDELRSFPALGPEGVSDSDINGRAAAIECYLDLNLPEYPPAQVIWSNYKKEIETWHGALEYKESYTTHFMKQHAESLTMGDYDTSKLVKVLDALVAEAALLHG